AIRRNPRWLIAAVALVVVSIYVQLGIAGRVPHFYGWVRPIMVIAAVGGLLIVLAYPARLRWVTGGLALSLAGLLFLPAAWSINEAAHASISAVVPQAGPRPRVTTPP